MALLLLACRNPAECDATASAGWSPVLEEEVRLDATATWQPVDDAVVTADATCATSCLTVRDGAARAEVVLNDDVAHELRGVIDSDAGVEVAVLDEDERVVATSTLQAGSADLALAFVPSRGGTGSIHVQPVAPGEARVLSLELVGETWAAVEVGDAEPLLFGFLMHIEEDASFVESEARWTARARVVEGLSGMLAAHGAKLGFQPHATFARGAAVWAPEWAAARAAEGTGWSAHVHGEGEGDELEPATREGRDALRDVGQTPADLNGGFRESAWSLMADIGFRSVTAFKDPYAETVLPFQTTLPWRPADGTGAADPDAFVVHDPDGPIVYLPGAPVREVDHVRAAGFLECVVSQARANATVPGVHVWHVLLHIDDFGPSGDEARAAYLDDGSFAADLAAWDEALAAVTDPLVASGDLVYATPDEMARAYLDAQAACP